MTITSGLLSFLDGWEKLTSEDVLLPFLINPDTFPAMNGVRPLPFLTLSSALVVLLLQLNQLQETVLVLAGLS